MKRHIMKIAGMITLAVMVASCNSFLEENPKTFLSPNFYFRTEAQTVAGVNGLYSFLGDIFNGDIEIGTQTYIFIDYLPGYGERDRGAGSMDLQQAMTLTVAENNGYAEKLWQTGYTAIENCNGVITGIGIMDESVDISQDRKDQLLGEAYFFRAFYYFNLVRLYGPIPLKTEVTTNLNDTAIELSSIETVYAQIEEDLEEAERLMEKVAWKDVNGRVAKGAVKSLMAKVYLTMAGYPLQKGDQYYNKAYNKAKEVYSSKEFELFETYGDLRDPQNENKEEYIWMIQRDADNAGSPVHTNMLPYPEPSKAISANSTNGGALTTTRLFYNSYDVDDLRRAEGGFYYTEHEALDGSLVQLDKPYIYKYWDQEAAETGKSGMNYPLIRYADVLLMMAEAKANADGGSTTDNDAVTAYYEVRNRAVPSEPEPTLITVDQVLKERFWELAFENQTWYDMIRTRKALNVTTGNIVNMVGYQTPGHNNPFKISDLLLPYPLRERRLNPNLVRD